MTRFVPALAHGGAALVVESAQQGKQPVRRSQGVAIPATQE
jgi:hypothetical protein